jgi:hypothetical protein
MTTTTTTESSSRSNGAAVSNSGSTDHNSNNSSSKYRQDGAEAREIARHLPYFPFKGIPRFYDIGGFLYQPDVFQRIVTIFADRYRDMAVDVIAGYGKMEHSSAANLSVIIVFAVACLSFVCFVSFPVLMYSTALLLVLLLDC